MQHLCSSSITQLVFVTLRAQNNSVFICRGKTAVLGLCADIAQVRVIRIKFIKLGIEDTIRQPSERKSETNKKI